MAALLANLAWATAPLFSQAASGQSGPADAELFDFILEGMKTGRYKLVSGVCRFTGTYNFRHKDDPGQNLKGPLEGFLAIDGEKTRYDLSRPGWITDRGSIELIEGTNRATANTIKGRVTTMFAKGDVDTTFHHSDNSLVEVGPSKDVKDLAVTEYDDIRAITFYGPLYGVKAAGEPLTLDQVCDDLVGYFSVEGRVAKVDESTYVVTWGRSLGDPPVQRLRWTLSVDVASGFTPKSYKFECARENEMKKANPWTLVFENKTDWREIHGVWVPSHHESCAFANEYGWGRGSEKTILEYHWESVNEPVDEDLFNYTTFEVPDRVGVQGPSGWIRKPEGLEVGDEPPKPRSERSYTPLLLAGILPILIIVFIVWRIKRASSRKSDGSAGTAP